MSGDAAVTLEGVTCTYAASGGSTAYTAVQDVQFTVAAGEFVSVVGPTGSGKSTILNSVAGLLRPSRGRVLIEGQPLVGLNRRAGYLFQTDALMPWKTALDNVAAGLEFRGESRAVARRKAQPWLARVGLATFGDRYPHQLSGGQRKRVSLAQTLILDPAILLMDEPFSALDAQTRHLMENELLALWAADRKSVIFITHDLEEAIAMSDRVVLLSAGPGARLVGEYPVTLPRPRDVAEVRLTPAFLDIHRAIWADLRTEVAKAHAHV
jgi:NitT/TauT family transport system ATP-binding protein